MERTCNQCGHTGQVETDFPKQKNYRGGYRPQCKKCHNGAAVEWQKANPDKFALIQQKYWQTEKGKAAKKRSCDKHRPKRNAECAAWRERMKAEGRYDEISLRYRVKRYGLTPDDYHAMLAEQDNGCAICKQPLEHSRVDHDHSCCAEESRSCGKCVRGVLCPRCNNLLGHAKDNILILQSAIDYLRNKKG